MTAAEFHARNRMDWVGVTHNEAMDEIRAVVRRSKPKDMCNVIERIAVDATGRGGEKTQLSPAERRAIGKSAIDRVGCRGRGGRTRNASDNARIRPSSSPVMNASRSSGDYELSADAWLFVDRITDAGESAGSAGDLATELAAITAEAQSLSPDDQSVIEAMASVSLSSFEYWEDNSEAMAAEMADAYGSCVGGGGGESCYYASSNPQVQYSLPAPFRLAANTATASACEINKGLIWRGDKWGASVGLSIGLLSRTVQGAIGGMFAGAAVGSGGAATYEFGRYLSCVF
ncbi:MAG: hypothetical protein O2973_09545 [Gemmatimonadetes bacterium]|nr:hypothetical protein [Gemmatimonadota bacterium]